MMECTRYNDWGYIQIAFNARVIGTMERIVILGLICLIKVVVNATTEEPSEEGSPKFQQILKGHKQWWDVVPPNETAEKIGDNVKVKAYVFYDQYYNNAQKRRKRATGEDQNAENPYKQYFENLFSQVQQYFKNQSILVTFKVEEVMENKNLSVLSGPFFDSQRTLENLTKYGQSLSKPKNTIFYLFTWNQYPFLASYITTGKAFGTSDRETKETFCSNNVSGAVIRHYHGSDVYWTTVKATAVIFGSDHFTSFSTQDRQKMKERFSHCPPNMDDQEIPAC
uniref:28 kDa Metastriate family member n=1 Tax=Rhipicephalus appendiculatus TaxID=34631 RepID=A0A131YSY0_RHIAP